MNTNLKFALGLAALVSLHSQNAQAAKYELCITCSGGGPYQVGSPTPNPGGNYLTAFCASKGAGTPVNMSPAKALKLKNGQTTYVCEAKKKKLEVEIPNPE